MTSLAFEKNHSGCCMENRLHMGKTIGRETRKEAIEINQVRYNGSCGSSKIHPRWLDLEYILTVKPAGFTGELDVGCEGKRQSGITKGLLD